MDSRCVRKLKRAPRAFCPMAIARLRWIEALGHEPSEIEEEKGPGCAWYTRSHAACFCFFKAVDIANEPFTEAQIAHQLCLSESSIKKAKESGLAKMAVDASFVEIRETHNDCPLVEDRLVDPYESIYPDMMNHHDSVSEFIEVGVCHEDVDIPDVKTSKPKKHS